MQGSTFDRIITESEKFVRTLFIDKDIELGKFKSPEWLCWSSNVDLHASNILYINLITSPRDFSLVFADMHLDQFTVTVIDPCTDQSTKDRTDAGYPEIIIADWKHFAAVTRAESE